MPTITVGCKQLFDALEIPFEESYDEEKLRLLDEDFDLLCFSYGIENDGLAVLDDGRRAFKIDCPANRYDLLCFEGLSRALRVFLGLESCPTFALSPARERVLVHESTRQVRPFVTCAILRNVTFTPDSYQSFLDLQDHLHRNICRRRSLVSIGTHDLDKLAFPVRYELLNKHDKHFAHLFTDKVQSLHQVLDEFRNDPKRSNLREYTDLIYDLEHYPVMMDHTGEVISLPPVINSAYSKMSVETKNIFIECTATDLTKAKIVLDTMVTMFARYQANPELVEAVSVVYVGGMPETVAAGAAREGAVAGEDVVCLTPDLLSRTCSVDPKVVNSFLGLELSGEEMCQLLKKMQLTQTRMVSPSEIQVQIPPTRSDILHAVDLVEDVGIAYGFNSLPESKPKLAHYGRELPVNQTSDLLRVEIAAAGYVEILTFGLCTHRSNFEDFGRETEIRAVALANPKTLEYQIARTCLVPGLLKTLQEHRAEQISAGLKLFEISDVVLLDEQDDTGCRNERRLAALFTSNQGAGMEHVHGLLDRVMQLLEVVPDVKYSPDGHRAATKKRGKKGGSYWLEMFGEENSTSSGAGPKTYLPGKGAKVMWAAPGAGAVPREVGTFGILHPGVLGAFDLKNPVSILEITLDCFVHYSKA